MCQKAIFGKKGIPDSVAILKKKIGNLFSWVLYVFFKFFFLNYTNGSKSRKASHIVFYLPINSPW